MAKWRRSTHAAGMSLEWQPIGRKQALATIRVFGGHRVPPPGSETSIGSDQNYRYFIVNRSGKLELQRRERLGMTLRNPGGHQLRFDEYPLRDDKRKKSPPKYSFYQLTLDDVLSPDFGREQLYTLDQQGFMARVRRNGQVKTWKRDPNRVEIPLKFGMYEAFRITDPSELYVMATDFPITLIGDEGHAEAQRATVRNLTRGINPRRRKRSVPTFDKDQLFVDVWEERDRLHIALFGWDGPYRERMTGDGVEIAEWWDDDARQMIEDGFFSRHGRFDKDAVKDYAYEMGLVQWHKYGA